MNVTRMSRIRLDHHIFEMPDRRKVGLSIGGEGVPLVFFHGIGMNRHVYLRLLSRLPQLGFLVIALDAPGHGESFVPMPGARSFAARMAATDEILDALGVQRALLVGHSMGGRTAAELAARHPARALGVVLIDPALGEAFDVSRDRMNSPLGTASGLAAGMLDTVRDRVGLRRLGLLRHLQMLGARSISTAAHPAVFLSAAAAIAGADSSAIALNILRENKIPVTVIHGEKDMIVPLKSAINAAQISDGTLVTLPRAYHSWVLPSPWTFTQILDQLIAGDYLGEELRGALDDLRLSRSNAANCLPYLANNSKIRDLVPAVKIIGGAHPRNNAFYHAYRIWKPAEMP